ncbi:MAG TPA: hypothetical protein DIS68_06295, partial [Lachnospiraceae bacterium]|nr:hypothetical protein [Lachnospiraceae bacterium]
MTIEITEKTNEELTMMVSGRIDTDTAGDLREVLDEVSPDLQRLVMDFRDVSYISSAGLRELLVCRKRFQGDRLLIKNVREEVSDILAVTGFDSLLPIEVMRTDVSTYVNLSFKELLERMVREENGRAVLGSEHDAYDWKDIDKASQIIAEDLARLGVVRGTHVGICGSNSINWILTFFALQKLGALA